MLYHTVPCHVVPYCTVSCCTILLHTGAARYEIQLCTMQCWVQEAPLSNLNNYWLLQSAVPPMPALDQYVPAQMLHRRVTNNLIALFGTQV